MEKTEFNSFGHWLSTRMQEAGISASELASQLEHSGPNPIEKLCSDHATLPIKEWPALCRILQLRFDEFLIVVEHFHPNWAKDYDQFINGCLRYLLWRIEQDPQKTLPFHEHIALLALNEMLDPAAIDRHYAGEERRADRKKGILSKPGSDASLAPRRITDLIHYLRNIIEPISLLLLYLPADQIRTLIQGSIG